MSLQSFQKTASEILACKPGDILPLHILDTPNRDPILSQFSGFVTFHVSLVFTSGLQTVVAKGRLRTRGASRLFVSDWLLLKIRAGDLEEDNMGWCALEKSMLLKAAPAGLTPLFFADGAIPGTPHNWPVTVMQCLPYQTVYSLHRRGDPVIWAAFDKVVRALNENCLQHGDLSPRNVLLDQETGKLWVVDLEDLHVLERPLGEADIAKFVRDTWMFYYW